MDAATQATDAESMLQHWTAAQAGFHRLTVRLAEEVTRRTGLPSSSVQVLLLLLHSPPWHSEPMTLLARHLEFSTAGITKVTDRLTAAGLIERSPCQTDRRVVRATLTPAGLEAAQQAADILAEALRRDVIGKIGPEDFARLTALAAAVDPNR
ncbi:MarR family winged helix-turn-helix transcriptional regulator [Actinoplanes subtropicus]|uniref:MarR family winged helix-turn-helix transcriptional regulator n=1 Tax=Actinoplanes subtropicus TaxID=543632 RepID=UPI00068EFE03|nr:MarR family transcriptional regulator [Actinoplanes subtropicus]